jgi:hypothetical protein
MFVEAHMFMRIIPLYCGALSTVCTLMNMVPEISPKDKKKVIKTMLQAAAFIEKAERDRHHAEIEFHRTQLHRIENLVALATMDPAIINRQLPRTPPVEVPLRVETLPHRDESPGWNYSPRPIKSIKKKKKKDHSVTVYTQAKRPIERSKSESNEIKIVTFKPSDFSQKE